MNRVLTTLALALLALLAGAVVALTSFRAGVAAGFVAGATTCTDEPYFGDPGSVTL